MKLIIFILSLFSVSTIIANGNAPKGYWACRFIGQEWVQVPGPNGIPTTQLQIRSYTSKWLRTKQNAYQEAETLCNDWSDTTCDFDGCKQKD